MDEGENDGGVTWKNEVLIDNFEKAVCTRSSSSRYLKYSGPHFPTSQLS